MLGCLAHCCPRPPAQGPLQVTQFPRECPSGGGQLGAHGHSTSRPEWTGDAKAQGGGTPAAGHSW